jgi:hypothetical protein
LNAGRDPRITNAKLTEHVNGPRKLRSEKNLA